MDDKNDGDPNAEYYAHGGVPAEPKPRTNDYVQVEDENSPHHGKTGWVEWIDTTFRVLSPYGVKFKDENGASNFRAEQLKIIETFRRTHEHFDAGVTVTAENIIEVAEWCDARIASPWGGVPRLHVKTGFGSNPDFKVEVGIGDKMEKTEDGKFQVWINPNARADDELIERGAGMEDRPYMKKERNFDPLMDARELVHRVYYAPHSDAPLPIDDIYVVWFCSTLQNWKALVSTNAKDDRYYEVTHDGEKKRTYVDEYGRKSNVTFHCESGIYDVMLVQEYKL